MDEVARFLLNRVFDPAGVDYGAAEWGRDLLRPAAGAFCGALS